MTDDTRKPEEIEREIETRRAALSSNIDALQDRFSIDTLVRQIGDQFREHGGDMGRSISEQVKANPIPLALTGIGLAWLMMGDGRTGMAGGREGGGRDLDRSRSSRHRPPVSRTGGVGVHDDGPSWLHDDFEGRPSHPDTPWPPVADDREEGSENVADRVGTGLSSASSSMSDAAASARSAVSGGAESVKGGIDKARSRIAEGTETLTEEGRRRVIAARRKAVDMRRGAMRSMGEGSDAAADFYDRQPLVVGALALAVGAALGGALPRTKVEDDLMGERSDALLAEAERIFEEEKSLAMEVAGAVTDEVRDIAAETKADLDRGAPDGRTAAEALGDKAKDAVERVTEAGKDAARDGKPPETGI